MKKIITCLFILSTGLYSLNAQTLSVDAEIKPRFEYRHGFSTLLPENVDPAAFIAQRSRLNLNYKSKYLKTVLSVQDVSTWGDTRQLQASDPNNSFSLFQAWAELALSENISTKLGRQVISYDDQRIFGGVDWALQGRFHDALLIQYDKANLHVDLGAAFNQEQQNIRTTKYDISGFFSYKTMQYLYAKKEFENISASFLFLNNGFQAYKDQDRNVTDGTFNRQTTGIYFKAKPGKFNLSGSAYHQFGEASLDSDISAYQAALNIDYPFTSKTIGAGLELLSGTDAVGEDKNRSFFPLFGTNHKFNGFMDYFYVGNHANNVGLNDVFVKYNQKLGKSSLLMKAHYFSSNTELANDGDQYLGTEVDIVFGTSIKNIAKLNVGYSQMFASENMSLIKGGVSSEQTNNWVWVQLKIKPNLLNFVIANE